MKVSITETQADGPKESSSLLDISNEGQTIATVHVKARTRSLVDQIVKKIKKIEWA